jgi:uncharacterized protein YggE
MKSFYCLSLAAALALSSCVPATHIHNNFGVTEPANALVVVGSGEASSAPDIARITLGAEAQNTNAQQAVSEVSAKMKAVLGALKSQGIADKDLRTANLNVFIVEPPPFPMPPPMPESMPPGRGPSSSGPPGLEAAGKSPPIFRASNTVSVTLRDLDRVGTTLSAAVQAGARAR